MQYVVIELVFDVDSGPFVRPKCMKHLHCAHLSCYEDWALSEFVADVWIKAA